MTMSKVAVYSCSVFKLKNNFAVCCSFFVSVLPIDMTIILPKIYSKFHTLLFFFCTGFGID